MKLASWIPHSGAQTHLCVFRPGDGPADPRVHTLRTGLVPLDGDPTPAIGQVCICCPPRQCSKTGSVGSISQNPSRRLQAGERRSCVENWPNQYWLLCWWTPWAPAHEPGELWDCWVASPLNGGSLVVHVRPALDTLCSAGPVRVSPSSTRSDARDLLESLEW
jgi:hypothetical protein